MSGESTATAVTVFHPSPDAEHDGWLAELLDSARTAEGFVSGQVALAGSGLEPAVSVVFSAEALLHAWLDGPDRALALAGGREHGFWPCAADIVTVDGSPPPAGVAGFRHLVAADRGAEFLAAQIRLVAVARAGFTGFLGAALFPAGPGGEQLSIVRFRTERQLAEWLDSDQRRAALPELRSSLTREFTSTSQTTSFGTTVRADHGRVAMTPPWKTAMLVLMVLYPTVMLLSRFLEGAGQHARQHLAVFAQRDVGDEAQPSLVDADQRRAVARPLARPGGRPGVADQRGRGGGGTPRICRHPGGLRHRTRPAVLGLLQLTRHLSKSLEKIRVERNRLNIDGAVKADKHLRGHPLGPRPL